MKVFLKHITFLVLLAILCGTVVRAQEYVYKDTTITYTVKSANSGTITSFSWMVDSVVVPGVDSASIAYKWSGTVGEQHTIIATPFNEGCEGESKSKTVQIYSDTATLPLYFELAPVSALICANPKGSAEATINFTVKPGSKATIKYEGVYQIYYKVDNGDMIAYPIALNTSDVAPSVTITKGLTGDYIPVVHTLRIMKIVGIGLVQNYNDGNAPRVKINVKAIPSIGEISY